MTGKTIGDLPPFLSVADRAVALARSILRRQIAAAESFAAYDEAVEHLGQTGDAKPLAKLLREGWEMPSQHMGRLAALLDPGPGYAGRRLVATNPKRTRRKALEQIGKDRQLRARIIALRDGDGTDNNKGMKLEAAIEQVISETGLSRAKCYEVLQLNNKETTYRCERILGNANE